MMNIDLSDDITAAVRELIDREAIRDLVARYGMALDDRDMEAVAAMFCTDGVFRYTDGSVQLQGRAAVLSYYNERLSQYGPTYHYPHSHVIDITGKQSGTGIVCAHAELALPTQETAIVAMRYLDRYARIGDAWQFAERAVQVMYFMPLRELPDRLSDPMRKRLFDPPRPADIPEGLATWQRYRANRR